MGSSGGHKQARLQEQEIEMEKQQYQEQKDIADQKAANLARVRQQMLAARFGGGFGTQAGSTLASLGGPSAKIGS